MDAIRLGRSLRALRRERGWRQRDLAARAGLSKSTVGRLELGQLDGVTVGTLEHVVAALGAWLDVSVRWNGESLDRLLDAAHAGLVERLVTRLRVSGWEAVPEVSFAIAGERGSIDVLAFHQDARVVLVVEVKSVVPDLQAMLHGLDRKARLAPAVARERGWQPAATSRLLVLADTRTNRRRIDAHAATLAAVLPANGREMVTWLRDPVVPALSGRLFQPAAPPTGRMAGGRQRVRVRGSGSSAAREPRGMEAARSIVIGPPHGTSSGSR